MSRVERQPFSEQQIALVQTFADQAVIAIENVCLSQAATAEILRIISTSPTDLQPVLDAVADNAARVCGANDAHVYRVEGNTARRVAHYGTQPILHASDSRPLQRDNLVGRAIVDRCALHIPDVIPLLDTEYPGSKSTAGATGSRTILVTPLLREGIPIGAILIRRLEVRPFSEKQVALLKTFADQTVIAIENVRLFKELEARNRDLTTALDQQTATSDILRAISGAQTDLQPVFDIIAASAVGLCEAARCTVWRRDGDLLHQVVRCEMTPEGHVVQTFVNRPAWIRSTRTFHSSFFRTAQAAALEKRRSFAAGGRYVTRPPVSLNLGTPFTGLLTTWPSRIAATLETASRHPSKIVQKPTRDVSDERACDFTVARGLPP